SAMASVPVALMFDATSGMQVICCLLLRVVNVRCNSTLARLPSSDRLGRMSTSSKSNLVSEMICMGFLHETKHKSERMRIHRFTTEPILHELDAVNRHAAYSHGPGTIAPRIACHYRSDEFRNRLNSASYSVMANTNSRTCENEFRLGPASWSFSN